MTSTPSSKAAQRWRTRGKARRPYRLADWLCFGLCGVSALLAASGPLAKWVWAADVVSLFRPYALLISAVVVAACVARLRVALLLIALGLLACEGALLAAPTLRGDAHPRGPGGADELTVITFNCLGSNPNSRTAVAWLRRMHPDIVVLEELPPRWQPALDTLDDRLPYRASLLESTRSDTDIFSRQPMRSAQAYQPATDMRALIHAVVDIDSHPVQVFGIHPNTLQTQEEWANRNNALELSAQWIAQTRRDQIDRTGAQAPALVLGDWNTPPWSPYFHAFLGISGLKSADAVLWPPVTRVLAAPFGLRIGSPIDHVATSPDVQVEGCETGPDLGSDHVPQICRISLRR